MWEIVLGAGIMLVGIIIGAALMMTKKGDDKS
jgi:hypothetical protein